MDVGYPTFSDLSGVEKFLYFCFVIFPGIALGCVVIIWAYAIIGIVADLIRRRTR
jgi:hypothetical protein